MIDWKTISLKDFAGFVSDQLRKREIDTVLVGGACVTVYSKNRYQSYDLDFVTYEDLKDVKAAFKELGFQEKNHYFIHKNCPWVIEFVSPPIAVGNEPIHEFDEIKTPLGTIRLLRPEDSVKDRLASYFHWNDREAIFQAVSICLEQKVDLKEIESWSIREGFREKFQDFLDKLKKEKAD